MGSHVETLFEESLVNAITIDVEDYFHTEAMSAVVPRTNWEFMPSRVERNTERLFQLFADTRVCGTFFFLGWVAERFPKLVRNAVSLGHEVACHSYWHRAIFWLTPKEFRDDTYRAKTVIEQQAQQEVVGYRAPSFSITPRVTWAFDVLEELGFEYDSSTNPILHDFYSNHAAPRHPHRIGRRLVELPIATWPAFRTNIPIGGGAYMRIFPFSLMRAGLSRLQTFEKRPAMLYFHPWEIDAEQPRLPAGLKSRFRQYTGLSTMERKLRTLMREFPVATVKEAFAHELRAGCCLGRCR